jgi:hypothetical protein
MTRNLFLSFTLLLFGISLQAQCVEGDCENGVGIFKQYIGDQLISTYKGHFQNSQWDGFGKLITKKGDIYEGEWSEGRLHGKGTLIKADGTVETGQFTNGTLSEADKRVVPQSECLEGNCNTGQGKSRGYKGHVYQGTFVKGALTGFGTITYPNGDRYEGACDRGLPSGDGSMYRRNGRVETGIWDMGRPTFEVIKIWALVVGVADYDNFPKLNFTNNDADKFYRHLISPEGGHVPSEQTKFLKDKEATAFNITNAMADLFEQADTSDLIIFYFAGHGLPGAFLPVDYQEDGSNQLLHTSINNLIMDSPAKFKLIIADACHSGSFALSYNDYKDHDYQLPPGSDRSDISLRDKIKAFYKSFENVKGGIAIMMSSASEEISLEATILGQGVFSYYIIQGLKGQANTNGDTYVSVKELFDYVSKYVGKFTYGFQTPGIEGDYDENMPVGIVPPR